MTKGWTKDKLSCWHYQCEKRDLLHVSCWVVSCLNCVFWCQEKIWTLFEGLVGADMCFNTCESVCTKILDPSNVQNSLIYFAFASSGNDGKQTASREGKEVQPIFVAARSR